MFLQYIYEGVEGPEQIAARVREILKSET